MRMKYLVAAATLKDLFLAGCSGSKEEVPDNPPNEIYATAQQKLQDGNWKQAITQLEALDNRYPHSDRIYSPAGAVGSYLRLLQKRRFAASAGRHRSFYAS